MITPLNTLIGLFGAIAYVSGALDGVIERYGKMIGAIEIGGRSIAEWGGTVTRVWSALGPIFAAGTDVIAKSFGLAWTTAESGFQIMISKLKLALKDFVDSFRKQIMEVAKDLANIGNKLSPSRRIAEKLMPYFKALSEDQKDLLRKVAQPGLLLEKYSPTNVIARGAAGAIRDGVSSLDPAKEETAIAAALTKRRAAASALKGSLKDAADKFKNSLADAGEVINKDVGPVFEKIFGTGKSGPIDSLGGIFQNLLRDWDEFQGKIGEKAADAAPARKLQTSITNLGSWSATSLARSETRGGSRVVQLAEQQLAELRKSNARGDRISARMTGSPNVAYAAGAV
jgi:hypothetical protein